MKKIHILEAGFKKKHPYKKLRETLFKPYWFPVDYACEPLRQLGYQVDYFSRLSPALFDCDILIISSRTAEQIINDNNDYSSRKALCEYLKQNVPRLVWFDLRDSAGNCQFDVLPMVDRYIKRSLYRNRSLYQQSLYFGREYSNYYNQQHNIIQPNENKCVDNYNPCEVLHEPELLDKMRAAWGCGAEYHWPIFNTSNIADYFSKSALLKLRPQQRVVPATRHPALPRPLSFCALFDEQRYSVKAVGHQRKLGREIAESLNIPNKSVGRVAKKDFYNTLADSQVTVSVFGWGEICFREYEATYCGSSVLMADMSNIETYPDFYQAGKFYTPFQWDFSDFEEKLHYLLEHDDERVGIAKAAQDFLMHQWTQEGREAFAKHFISIL